MSPGRHLAVSSALALGCGWAFRSPEAAGAAFLAGTALDFDHLLDFKLNRSGRLTPARLLRQCNEYRFDRLYLVLHSLEAAGAFAAWAFLAGGPVWAQAAAVSLAVHMMMDAVGNGMNAGAYFLSYRIAVGFESRKLVARLPPEAMAYWGSYANYRRRRPLR